MVQNFSGILLKIFINGGSRVVNLTITLFEAYMVQIHLFLTYNYCNFAFEFWFDFYEFIFDDITALLNHVLRPNEDFYHPIMNTRFSFLPKSSFAYIKNRMNKISNTILKVINGITSSIIHTNYVVNGR